MSSTVIPKEQLTPFERWELASFETQSGGGIQSRAKKNSALATVSEVESIRIIIAALLVAGSGATTYFLMKPAHQPAKNAALAQ